MPIADGYHYVQANDLRVRDQIVCDWAADDATRNAEVQVIYGNRYNYISCPVLTVRPIESLLTRPPVSQDMPAEQYTTVVIKMRGHNRPLDRWVDQWERIIPRTE